MPAQKIIVYFDFVLSYQRSATAVNGIEKFDSKRMPLVAQAASCEVSEAEPEYLSPTRLEQVSAGCCEITPGRQRRVAEPPSGKSYRPTAKKRDEKLAGHVV